MDDGDECHYTIKGVREKEGGKLAKRLKPMDLMICDKDGPRQMTDEDFVTLEQAFGMR